jgi:amino acid adenylation domain-containing protein
VQVGEEIVIEFLYNSHLLPEEYVEAIRGHFEQVVMEIANGQQTRVGDLGYLSQVEEKRLAEFNRTEAKYPDKTVVELFEEQVERTPDAVAVVFGQTQLTYGELNERANGLAHHLHQTCGIGREDRVGVLLERSEEVMVALLGVLKAGAVYMPIDPEYPEERRAFMISDSGCSLVIDQNWMDSWRADGSPENLENPENPENPIEGEDLAYVIYTSGSTGRPKGVLIEHRGLSNRLVWMQEMFGMKASDRVLQKTNFCFDVSVWELLWPVVAGGALVFARPGGHKDPGYLREVIESQGITIVHFVPSMLEVFLSELEEGRCSGLRKVMCSGEALKPVQVALFREKLPGVSMYNLYGPTEASIDVTYWAAPLEGEGLAIVPIGRPIANTHMYILDGAGKWCPIGVPGELLIGGVQVARGYLNRAELTAAKFVESPVVEGGRLYRTGDLGRWLPDGNIEFLGRKDDQVKVRGYRIELGEIEQVLSGQSGVKGCCVVVRDERLTAYVVLEGELDRSRLEAGLSGVLPEYMVPRVWMSLEALPLTASGKIDRKALPDPWVSGWSDSDYTAPRNAVEAELAAIWSNLLRVERDRGTR